MSHATILSEVNNRAPCTCRGILPYLRVIVITFLAVFFTTAVITYRMPRKFESTAVIQVLPRHVIGCIFGPSSGIPSSFVLSESKAISTDATLQPVVQQLNLTTRWQISEEQAIAIIRNSLVVKMIKDTDLIEIRVKHTDAEETRDIAEEIYLAYKKLREDKERALNEWGLRELEIAILDQRSVVDEAKNRFDQLGGTATQSQKKILHEELDTQREQLDRMIEKRAMDLIDLKPPRRLVELHEAPVHERVPSSPNVGFNLSVGAAGGLQLGLLIALLMRSQGRCGRCAA